MPRESRRRPQQSRARRGRAGARCAEVRWGRPVLSEIVHSAECDAGPAGRREAGERGQGCPLGYVGARGASRHPAQAFRALPQAGRGGLFGTPPLRCPVRCHPGVSAGARTRGRAGPRTRCGGCPARRTPWWQPPCRAGVARCEPPLGKPAAPRGAPPHRALQSLLACRPSQPGHVALSTSEPARETPAQPCLAASWPAARVLGHRRSRCDAVLRVSPNFGGGQTACNLSYRQRRPRPDLAMLS